MRSDLPGIRASKRDRPVRYRKRYAGIARCAGACMRKTYAASGEEPRRASVRPWDAPVPQADSSDAFKLGVTSHVEAER